MTMEIPHPRRILAVSRPDSGLVELLKGLTGSAPALAGDSIAGVTHDWSIKTNYYTSRVPIWLDEIHEPEIWSKEFLAPEAREVLTVLGAFIEGCGYTWDGVCLAVAMPQSTTPYLEKSFDEWEELCQEHGFEFVDFESKGRNEYSEPMGIDRLKEALEANEWEGGDGEGGSINLEDLEDDGDENKSIGFGIEAAEMEMEMFGMKQAIYGESTEETDSHEEVEDEDGVDQLEALMLRMQAVKDMGADLPEAERKRFAAKAVNDLMKTL
ncbi:hypothetical protein DID88_000427 [Monilinia fructigena]|uniref:Alpha and gamma adaptin binding protein p34 n=1 Tax=Monilinia fructigena TaxID=38457 RepID=A0A395IJX9_9HELO|nr:hypothetical protein DID88_000427 [Monilinia fructigena]